MPNHVINEITLHGVKLEDCKQYIFDKAGNVSFAVLLPLPLNYWPGSVGADHEKAFPGTHLDAAREVWGTKWDAYGDPVAEDSESGVVIRFKSAWNHPRGWTCALFNTLNCDITVNWLDEGQTNAHSEIYTSRDKWGDMRWEEGVILAGSDEHRRLHKLLWGVEEFPPEENEE